MLLPPECRVRRHFAKFYISMGSEEDRINWNVELEVSLFHAMHAHKPVGVNRHFQMVFLHDKLNSAVSKKITARDIWSHLSEMYDLQALHESECLPFPNKELEFGLPPETVYGDLVEQPFPRVVVDERPAQATSVLKEEATTKEASGASSVVTSSKDITDNKQHGNALKGGRTTTTPVESAVSEKRFDFHSTAEDSPKGDQRKRTRHSLQPTTAADSTSVPTNSTTKRARRT